MKSETILRAVAHAKPEYLEQAAQPMENKRRSAHSLPRFGLVAAVIAVLLITGVAAAVIYGPQIFLTKKSDDSFDLMIKNSEAAEDAPGYLAQYYLPAALPEGSVLTSGTLSWDLHLDWLVPTPNGGGQITFSQTPLRKYLPEDHFVSWGGLNPDDLTQGTCEIGGTAYWTLSYATGHVDATTYFWKDPANHYLMNASFNELVPQEVRESFLTSVSPASQQEIYACLGVAEQSAWRFGAMPAGWSVNSYGLDASEVSFSTHSSASDGIAHDVYLEQRSFQNEDDFTAFEKREREIDGTAVTCYTQQADVEGNHWVQETWCFLAPDGNTALQLTFFSADGTAYSEEDQLTFFRGLQQAAVQNLDLSELNRPK